MRFRSTAIGLLIPRTAEPEPELKVEPSELGVHEGWAVTTKPRWRLNGRWSVRAAPGALKVPLALLVY